MGSSLLKKEQIAGFQSQTDIAVYGMAGRTADNIDHFQAVVGMTGKFYKTGVF